MEYSEYQDRIAAYEKRREHEAWVQIPLPCPICGSYLWYKKPTGIINSTYLPTMVNLPSDVFEARATCLDCKNGTLPIAWDRIKDELWLPDEDD